jgi:predicted nucleotidyltransferase
MTEDQESVRARYEDALARIVEKAKADPYILTVILLGSLSYDVVWERSDIDICIVTQEAKHKKSLTLTENDVNIHAFLVTRSEFKRILEGAVQSGFMHSLMSKGRIVFSRDETIDELYESRTMLGDRDREIRMLSAVITLMWSFVKAQKWHRVKQDVDYSFFWIMKSIDTLAIIEAVWNGEIAGREVIHQALRLNPAMFEKVYTDLIRGPKTLETIGAALETIESYVMDRRYELFRPIFEYLAEAGAPRTATEISDYFSSNLSLHGADAACEWLADQGLIEKVGAPVRVTEKSRVDFQEAAYYFDPEAER